MTLDPQPGVLVYSLLQKQAFRLLQDNPVHVKVKPSDVQGYFLKVSDCLAEQIVTIDKKQVVSKVGHIPEDSEIMQKINRAVCMQLGIGQL